MVFEEVYEAALFVEVRQWNRDSTELLLRQMRDRRPGGELGQRPVLRVMFEEIAQETRVECVARANTVECLLEREILGSPIPDRAAADLPAFANRSGIKSGALSA